MIKRDFILKYTKNGEVKVIEIKATTPNAVVKMFNEMLVNQNLWGAKILEIKRSNAPQTNLFQTHPTIEDFHI